jgi:hypothetical protein
MKTRNALISLGIAAALAAGPFSLAASAHGSDYGRGARGSYSQGYEPGHGPMHWNGYGHRYGYGRDDSRAQGYGPGHHMRGWNGGHGPSVMHGYGYGRGRGHGMMGW